MSSYSTTWPCISSRRFGRRSNARVLICGFLPPYSPGLNQIEQAFAKLEHSSARRGHGSVD
jgi:transposase